MRKRRILGFLSVVIAVVIGGLDFAPVGFQENTVKADVTVNDSFEYDQPDEGMDINDTGSPKARLLRTLSDSEFQNMIQDKNVQTYESKSTVAPDKYEPNDSWEKAYSYKQIPKMSGDVFREGYASANCHEEGNEDWFYLSMTWGYDYDVVLKNLYRQDRHIYIWRYFNNAWEQWGAPNPQTGMPEKFIFSCPTISKYYIQIVGGGPLTAHYFFAVERKGTVNTALWPSEVTEK